jgi:translation initiation factor IF-1
MSKKEEIIETTGKVTEILPNSTFRVKVDNMEHILLCYLGGRLKMNKIKIVIGDPVRIEMSAYDLDRGRITFRL